MCVVAIWLNGLGTHHESLFSTNNFQSITKMMSCDNSNLFTFEQGTHNQRVWCTFWMVVNATLASSKTTKKIQFNEMHLRKKTNQKN